MLDIGCVHRVPQSRFDLSYFPSKWGIGAEKRPLHAQVPPDGGCTHEGDVIYETYEFWALEGV